MMAEQERYEQLLRDKIRVDLERDKARAEVERLREALEKAGPALRSWGYVPQSADSADEILEALNGKESQ